MTKRVIILGAGESGVGAALLAKAKGLDPFVSDLGSIKEFYKNVIEENGIDYEEGKHSLEIILQSEEVIKSPGIPDNATVIEALIENNIKVISELEFAYRYTNAKIIAVTGTNGKSTTVLLIYHLLKNSKINVGLAGNIGNSFAKQVVDSNNDVYVIEISSFQLDGLKDFKADVSVLLNITPDHLDRYDNNFGKYIDSKIRVANNQTENDAFVFNYDDLEIKEKIQNCDFKGIHYPFSINSQLEKGAHLIEDNLHFNIGEEEKVLSSSIIPIKGDHNLSNAMAAILASLIVGAEFYQIVAAIPSFKNAPHRMEVVCDINGVKFINDSKATNVESALKALQSYDQITWIAGGIDKGNDYAKVTETVKKNVKALVCLGKDNIKLMESFTGIIEDIFETGDVNEAVKIAFKHTDEGGVVLLSPACASFDLFDNYEHRGNRFKEAVREYKHETEQN